MGIQSVVDLHNKVAKFGLSRWLDDSFAVIDRSNVKRNALSNVKRNALSVDEECDSSVTKAVKIAAPLAIAGVVTYFAAPTVAAAVLGKLAWSASAKLLAARVTVFSGIYLLEHLVAFPVLSKIVRLVGDYSYKFFGYVTGHTKENNRAFTFFQKRLSEERESNRTLTTLRDALQRSVTDLQTTESQLKKRIADLESQVNSQQSAIANQLKDRVTLLWLSENQVSLKHAGVYLELFEERTNAQAAVKTLLDKPEFKPSNISLLSAQQALGAFLALQSDPEKQKQIVGMLEKFKQHEEARIKEEESAAKLKSDAQTSSASSSAGGGPATPVPPTAKK